ncbi:MAG: hypothetical protein HQK65_12850 [Desulfamplus sp.]|nr:hypothetical protein [Desulfamplus sp.]
MAVTASNESVFGESGYSNVELFTIFQNPMGTNAPDGAIWKTENIHHETPPQGYEAVLGWFQVATMSIDHDSSIPAIIDIDWMKVVEITAGGDRLVVYEEDYDSSGSCSLSDNDGGLFLREPRWFPPGDYHTSIINSNISNDNLRIDVGAIPTRIAHWWTERIIANENSSYEVETRVRISGELMFQIGSDYWRTLDAPYTHWDATCQTSNNCEAWVSDWYGDTDNDYVTIKAPLQH